FSSKSQFPSILNHECKNFFGCGSSINNNNSYKVRHCLRWSCGLNLSSYLLLKYSCNTSPTISISLSLVNCLFTGFCWTIYVPTVFDNIYANDVVNGKTVNLGVWDTARKKILLLSLKVLFFYQVKKITIGLDEGADVFILAFSLISRPSFENIAKKWVLELQHYSPNVPIVLVGTKLDLRENKFPMNYPGACTTSIE
ncbi:LOW QUALITY PROTEIN: hypothetical protein HID58_018335, partial [Brassica napus]